ncbi:hypothetical protein FOMPIDRAFT_1026521 [Fomitopsis schrenkii]|uniref:Uncharacterized protein n=1 Tax=Fomitopsis schrenkii TaxID=2126942 RepID=S8F3G7_FOMSC|nr:hypothetical protein FOMPIDRAFT_1026521 [Fomitopsis schrenkii]
MTQLLLHTYTQAQHIIPVHCVAHSTMTSAAGSDIETLTSLRTHSPRRSPDRRPRPPPTLHPPSQQVKATSQPIQRRTTPGPLTRC